MSKNFTTKIQVLAAAAATTLSLSAQAGFLIEPYLGYNVGSGKQDPTIGGEASYDTSALGIGARLGLTFTALWVAADYSMQMSGKLKDDADEEFDYSGSRLGLTVGMSLPVIRIWAGYGLTDVLSVKDDTGSESDFSGSNIKVGFGFDIFPMVDLNLEYIMSTYNKVEPGDFDASFESMSHNAAFVSLSVPL